MEKRSGATGVGPKVEKVEDINSVKNTLTHTPIDLDSDMNEICITTLPPTRPDNDIWQPDWISIDGSN
jgi:hypothetical protein